MHRAIADAAQKRACRGVAARCAAHNQPAADVYARAIHNPRARVCGHAAAPQAGAGHRIHHQRHHAAEAAERCAVQTIPIHHAVYQAQQSELAIRASC